MPPGRRPPLDEQKALFEATVAAEGVTTSAGEGTGLSLVDAGLAGSGANSYVSMMAIIYPGQPTLVDSKDITAFADGTGAVTVASAFKGGQVAAGVPYKIVTFRFVPAEVAAIAAAVAVIDAFHNIPGVDAVTNAQMRDVIGGKADTASETAVNTDSLISYLKGLLAITGTRAAAAAYATSATGVLVAYAKALVDAGIAVQAAVSDETPAAGEFDTALTEASNDHYNGMLMMFLDGNLAGQAHLVDDYVGAEKNCAFAASDQWTEAPANGDKFVLLPSPGAYLKKIFTAVAAIPTAPALASVLGALDTAAAEGAVTTEDEVMAYVKQLVTAAIAEAASTARVLCSMDFWSDSQEEVVMTGSQTAPSLPSVAVADLPTNATIVRAIAMFKFRMVENTNAAENSLDKTNPQPIQVQEPANGEAYTDAINFVDEQFKIAATTREGGDVLIGSIDIGTKVVANETYSFRWLNAKAHLGNLQFNDVQTGLRIWYSI